MSALVLERPVDSITVGHRLRRELGDISELVESIVRLGLLEPIVITPTGVLVLGWRRLEATRRTGARMIKVTVNPRITSRLEQVLAELHENTLHRPFNAREAAALYAEVHAIEAEEAARRQAASRFGGSGSEPDPLAPGGGSVPPPLGKTREIAARKVTGKGSYHTHERVLEMEQLAAQDGDPALRDIAARALRALDADEPVARHFQDVKTAELTGRLRSIAVDQGAGTARRDRAQAALAELAAEASPRVRLREAQRALADIERMSDGAPSSTIGWDDLDAATVERAAGIRFRTRLVEVGAWWEAFDPEVVARGLDDTAWATVESHALSLARFVEGGNLGRATRPTIPWD